MSKKYIFISLISIGVFGLALAGVNILKAQTAAPINQLIVGGPCSYKSFNGNCAITSIPVEGDPLQGDLAYKNILFKFTPTTTLDLTGFSWIKAEDITGEEQQEYPGSIGLNCLAGVYPITSENLTKCGVKVGAVFGCEMKLITSGTCTPKGFDFDDSSVCRNENYGCSIDNVSCCAGLKEVSYAFPDSNGACIAANCGSICRPCGNGVCDSNENICNCPEDCKKSLTLISPNGGEIWEEGKTYDVKWKSDGILSDAKINLQLSYVELNSVDRYEIAMFPDLANTGSYSWTISDPLGKVLPLSKLKPDQFRMRVIYSTGTVQAEDYSDSTFSIIKSTTPTPAPPPKLLSVQIPNGGEIWEPGKTYEISWSKSGFTDTDKLNIQVVNYEYGLKCLPLTIPIGGDISGYSKCGPFIYKIAANIPVNKGIYSWTVPSTIRQSKTYKVRIETEITGVAYPDQYKIASSATTIEPYIPPTVYYSDESDNYFGIVSISVPTSTPVPTPVTSCAAKEGTFCGGIAGIICCRGLTCQYDGNYPDAGGKCVSVPTSPPISQVGCGDQCAALGYAGGACTNASSCDIYNGPDLGESWDCRSCPFGFISGTQECVQPGDKVRCCCEKVRPTPAPPSPSPMPYYGFRNAYWQCYDGKESFEGGSTSCKTSETWQKYADEFCHGHCYADKSKCGVNTFKVWNECGTTPTVSPVPTTPVPVPTVTSVPVPTLAPVPVPSSDCAQQCRTSGYQSGTCRSYLVEEGKEKACQAEEANIGQTNDCLVPLGLLGKNTTCCCSKGEEQPIFGSGTIIKSSDNPMVYLIVNNKKLWIPSIKVFNQLKLDWSRIKTLSKAEFDSILEAQLIRATGEAPIYIVSKAGYKRHLPNPEVFESYRFRWSDVVEVDSFWVNSFPNILVLQQEGDYKVYKLEKGSKRWIKTAEAFEKLGYDWPMISTINKTEFNFYQEGNSLE